jgi:hypothetical protein
MFAIIAVEKQDQFYCSTSIYGSKESSTFNTAFMP